MNTKKILKLKNLVEKITTFKISVVEYHNKLYLAEMDYDQGKITLIAHIGCSGSRLVIVRQILSGIMHKLDNLKFDNFDFYDPHTKTVVMKFVEEDIVLRRAKHYEILPYVEKIKRKCYQLDALNLFSFGIQRHIERNRHNKENYSLQMPYENEKYWRYYIKSVSYPQMLDTCRCMIQVHKSLKQDLFIDMKPMDAPLVSTDEDFDVEDFDSPILFSEN